jgi:hypothetical protein
VDTGGGCSMGGGECMAAHVKNHNNRVVGVQAAAETSAILQAPPPIGGLQQVSGGALPYKQIGIRLWVRSKLKQGAEEGAAGWY